MSLFKKKVPEILAINFSDRSLEVVKVRKESSEFRLVGLSRLEIEAGIIEDGKVVRPQELVEVLKKVLHQAKPMPLHDKDVVISLPESKIFSISFTLPNSFKNHELEDAIRHRAAEVIPIEPELLVSDFTTTIVGDQQEIFYVATYQSLVQEYNQVFDRLNMRLRFIGMESVALARAVIGSDLTSNEILLDIGARTTIASIIQHGTVRETVTIPIAGEAITAQLGKDHSISSAESEVAKEQKGLSDEPDNQYADSIRPVVDQLIVEVNRFYAYWRGRSSESVQAVLLAGGTAQLPGLAGYLQARLNLPVRLTDLPATFQIDKAKFNIQKFLPVIGLALLYLEPTAASINFFKLKSRLSSVSTKSPAATVPTAEKEVQRRKIPLWRLVTLLSLLLVALGAFGFIWWRSTTPNVPVVVPEILDRTITSSFVLDVGAKTPLADSLKGKIEKRALVATMDLDSKYWQRITGNAQSEGKDSNDSTAMYTYVINDLVGKLWHDNYSSLAGSYDQSGDYLLNAFPAYDLATSSPSLAKFKLRQNQSMTIGADMTVVSVPRESLRVLLDSQWRKMYDQQPLPGNYQVTTTTIKPNGEGVYLVTLNIYSPIDN